MLHTTTGAIYSSVDTMVGLFTHSRAKLLSLFERSAPNTEGSIGAKRVKLSNDGPQGEDSGVSWRSQETASSSQPQRPLVFDGESQSQVSSKVETSGVRSSAPIGMLAVASMNGVDSLEDKPTSSFQTNHPGTTQNLSLNNPRSRSQLYKTIIGPKRRTRPYVSIGSFVKLHQNNSSANTRLPSDETDPPIEVEIGEEVSPSHNYDTGEKESLQVPATLTVIDKSEGILDTSEAFGELKISDDVIQREEERERKARKRKEEVERQRIELERRREEERRHDEDVLRRKAEEQRLREETKRRGGLRQPNNELFPPLTPDWTARVQRSLVSSSGDLAETPETKLKSHDFERLVPPTVWLNDNIVNGTLLWLDRFINEAAGITNVKTQTRKCLMPGSFFFTRLLDHGVKGTERTLRRLGVNKDNILEVQIILMPICQVNHWTLVVVEPPKRRISHFDSLNPAGSDSKRELAKEWMKSILGDSFIEAEWSYARYRAPRQTNGWDCGVHTVLNGVCLGLGIEPAAAYSSDQLPDLRKRIAAMLLNQGFKGEFSLEGC